MNPLREIAASLGDGVRTLTREPRYLIYALLIHAGFLMMFMVSFEWSNPIRPAPPPVEVVQAVLVDESAVQREVEKLKQEEARKAAEEADRQRRQREAEEARKREEQRLADLKRQQEQAQKQAEQQRKQEEQRLAEIKRQQEQAQKQAEEQRKREEQRLAEVKRQEEARKREEQEARKREEQRLAEQKKRQEEEARQRAEEQRRRDEQAAAERARREQTEVDRYVLEIQRQVARSWIRPPNWTAQQCVIRVNLIPGGDVVGVTIVRSCGDPVFDRSVESAVWRAAPLRVPPADSGLFDRFRELEFVFKPEP